MLPRINSKEAAVSTMMQLLRNTKAAYLHQLGLCPAVMATMTNVDKKYYSRTYFKDERQASTLATLGTLGYLYSGWLINPAADHALIRMTKETITYHVHQLTKMSPGAIIGGIFPVVKDEGTHLLTWVFCDELKIEYTLVEEKSSIPEGVDPIHPMEACCINLQNPTVLPRTTSQLVLPEAEALHAALKDYDVAWNPKPEPMSMETLSLMHKSLRDAKPNEKLGRKDEL